MKRGLIDLSSVLWTSLLGGKDGEYGKWVTKEDGKEVLINSAAYGYEGAVTAILDFMKATSLVPHQLLLVKEGMNSKQVRTALHPAYKFGRDKVPEQYIEFEKCREMVIDAFTSVGASAVWQDGVEADDVLGYLAGRLQGDVVVMSGDKDLAVLVDGRVRHYRAGVFDANPFGDFPHHLIQVYIALVGDASDKISGAPGFGAKAWDKVYAAFGDGGLEIMLTLIREKRLAELVEDVADVPELQKVIDGAVAVYLSYELGRLMVERVNTLQKPLQWRVGMVKPRGGLDSRLRGWGGVQRIVHAGNLDGARDFFVAQMARSPEVSLDLETYTNDESDAWLERRTKKGGGVDVMGSRIASCGLSFGDNGQYHFYLTTAHAATEEHSNLTLDQMREFLELVPKDKITLAQFAAGFELPVLFNHFGEAWKDNGWRGLFPNMHDTKIAACYWDENQHSHGLKQLSKLLLNYDQTSYDTVTTREELASEWDGVGRVVERRAPHVKFPTGRYEDPFFDEDGVEVGDKEIFELNPGPELVVVQRKMNELTAAHVVSYGIEDVVTAQALWWFFRVAMEIDGTFDTFMAREQKPMYLSALSYCDGVNIDMPRLMHLKTTDDEKFAKHSATMDAFLVARGWEGTICPVMLSDQEALAYLEGGDGEALLPSHLLEYSARGIKAAHKIIVGVDLDTQVRTPSKLSKLIEETDPLLSTLIANKDFASINELIRRKFIGSPNFDVASPKQVAALVYGEMGLPTRLRNKPTETMRAKGLEEGTVQTDEDALKMAQKMGDVLKGSAEYNVLTALMEMKSISTKRGLYYEPYPNAIHWKTGKIHPEMVQSSTNTLRWAGRNPNLQQLDSDPTGIRSVILPHHRNAVIGSLDESGQEVRQAADYCQDAAMLTCFLGREDQLRDVHSIVGCKILSEPYRDLRIDSEENTLVDAGTIRKLSKGTFFSLIYGSSAAGIAKKLGIKEELAQSYIDSIFAMFPGLPKWKQKTEKLAEKQGWVPVHGGTVRHLGKLIASDNRYESSKALRQASNARIQGAGANQIKKVMCDIWDSDLIEKYDYRWMFPVHDETVHSMHKDHAAECLQVLHGFMTAKFLDVVPSASSIGIGRSFGGLTEMGETFDADFVRKTINDIFTKKESHV